MLGRWLATRPKLLILDEPTHGVDVGAKAEIYTLIRSLAAEGMGVMLISSELPEVLALAHRIVVMHEGRVTGILPRADATEEMLMAYATGVRDDFAGDPGMSAWRQQVRRTHERKLRAARRARLSFRGWDAARIANRFVQLVAVPDIGGRIMAYDLGDTPVFLCRPAPGGQAVFAGGEPGRRLAGGVEELRRRQDLAGATGLGDGRTSGMARPTRCWTPGAIAWRSWASRMHGDVEHDQPARPAHRHPDQPRVLRWARAAAACRSISRFATSPSAPCAGASGMSCSWPPTWTCPTASAATTHLLRHHAGQPTEPF